MQRRPTVGPGSQKGPFRERLPGTISKQGKGTALQGGKHGGVGGCRGDGIAKVAIMGNKFSRPPTRNSNIYIYIYIHTYIHTYIDTYIDIHRHTYIYI